MRFFTKKFVAACAGIVVAASTFTVAGALIDSSTGVVIRLSTPPASVKLNALEHATSVHTFNEKQGVTLAAAVSVDAVNPGTYAAFPNGTAKIAAGTVVDSHLIHSDIPNRNYTTRRVGSVKFAEDILGIVASTARLGASDSLGATGTLYAGTTNWRGLESGGENGAGNSFSDKFTISADRRTVSFDLQTLLMDELRVITKPKNTLTTTVTDIISPSGPDPVQAGDNVTYVITVTNTGTTNATNVQVRDEFPGATLVSATAPGGCTGTGPVTCTLGTIAPGASASATIVVKSPATAGTLVNTATSPPGANPSVSESTTVVSPVLNTTISDSSEDFPPNGPDPVTAGLDTQYLLTVTNNGIAPVADAHVIDTLPAGTTLKQAPASCTGTGPVDCALGALAVGASAEVKLLVTSPSTVPEGGQMTNTAVATPGDNAVATETTTVEEPEEGVAKDFVLPGESLTIEGANPATITLPNTGFGAPVVITQGEGTFCAGPCDGPATTISPFEGYSDPDFPIELLLEYNFPDKGEGVVPTSLTEAAQAFGSTLYKHLDTDPDDVGTVIPECPAAPRPAEAYMCHLEPTIDQPTPNNFVVRFTVLYLSGDPGVARRR